jgi:hypothetical protein
MSLNIEFVNLDVSTFAMSIGKTQEEADQALQNFADEVGITINDTYFFEFVVTQGTKRNVTYLSYGVVPDGTKAKSGIQIGQLKHQNFVKAIVPENEFRLVFESNFGEEIQDTLKAKGYKLDMSKVFGLIKKQDSNYHLYFQYK